MRWQEVLHGYNVWAHLESHVIQSACQSMAKHAATSSNLAALCLHVTRMLQDLIKSTTSDSCENEDEFTQTIALVGKARATAGALNLVRILIHFVLAQGTNNLEEVFVYRNRDITERHAANRMAGQDLCNASLAYVSSMSHMSWQRVPELYDATHQCLQLVLVLFSTQLYQPMISSTQRQQQQVDIMKVQTISWTIFSSKHNSDMLNCNTSPLLPMNLPWENPLLLLCCNMMTYHWIGRQHPSWTHVFRGNYLDRLHRNDPLLIIMHN